MKRLILLIIVPLLLSGCKKYLDQDPESLNTLDKVFSNRLEATKWYNRIYSTDYFANELHDSQYYNHWFFATDDAANIQDAHVTPLVQGQLSPASPTFGSDRYHFKTYYQGIRHCNVFLENVGRCKDLGELEKRRMIAEVRFMRAMFHFWMLRIYGPIAIMEKSVSTDEATNAMARNTWKQCVDWITAECDFAIANGMPETRMNTEWGMPTIVSVKAMKSRLLLMDASPMYNGNKVYASWTNTDGTVLMNQVYDKEKWKKAADAAKEVIDVPGHSLLKVTTANPTFDDYILNYRKITTTWNDESLWARPASTYWWTMSSLPGVFFSWNARNSVTLELVNDYFMANGQKAKPLNDWFTNKQFSSANANGTIANTFWMFTGREPRFYASTHFPNMKVSYATSKNPGISEVVDFWYSGASGLSQSSGNRNHTGFSIRKNIPTDVQSNRSEGQTTTKDIAFPVIRLGEVYLNYAEALNEYYGSGQQTLVLQYLNEIRTRAGIPAYTGTYTQDEMREMIRTERRVELAWESHRYFDVKRWFIAHGPDGVFNHPVHGLDMTRGAGATDPAFYSNTIVQNRIFRLEHYMLPLNASQVEFNKLLVQAPFY